MLGYLATTSINLHFQHWHLCLFFMVLNLQLAIKCWELTCRVQIKGVQGRCASSGSGELGGDYQSMLWGTEIHWKNDAETIFTHKVLVNFTNSYNIVAETPTIEIKKRKKNNQKSFLPMFFFFRPYVWNFARNCGILTLIFGVFGLYTHRLSHNSHKKNKKTLVITITYSISPEILILYNVFFGVS